MDKLDRITSDPEVLGGRATLRGMRISVEQVVNIFASGMTVDEIVREYPFLEPEDVWQALQHSAEAALRALNAGDETLQDDRHRPRSEPEGERRFLVASKLYELGRLSAGQAARLVGIPRFEFLDELSRRGLTVVHLDADSIEDELGDSALGPRHLRRFR